MVLAAMLPPALPLPSRGGTDILGGGTCPLCTAAAVEDAATASGAAQAAVRLGALGRAPSGLSPAGSVGNCGGPEGTGRLLRRRCLPADIWRFLAFWLASTLSVCGKAQAHTSARIHKIKNPVIEQLH